MNYPEYIKSLYEAVDQQNINCARGIFDQIFVSVEKVLKACLAKMHGVHWLETKGVDVVQSAGLKIWDSLKEKRFDLGANSKFSNWCIGFLFNTRKDYWRKISCYKEVAADDFSYKSHPDKAMQPDVECEQYENALRIMDGISNLPELQKAIVLDKIMHKSGVDIAKKLGITTVKVSRELNSARKTLSELLPQGRQILLTLNERKKHGHN